MFGFVRRSLACITIGAVTAIVVTPHSTQAQSALNLNALAGLVPFSALLKSKAGAAALAANYTVTAAIHNGTSGQPALLPLDAERDQSISDAYITSANAAQLADALGTTLGTAYRARAQYASTDDGKTLSVTQVSPNVASLIAYTFAVSTSDSGSAKFFFANETVSSKTGVAPVSSDAAKLMTAANGETDVLGKAYHLPGGSAGADPYGDSRPFQTEKNYATFSGPDYFGVPAKNDDYLHGPAQNLTDSPSFPSGHTTYGYTESLLLAILVPQRYPQMIVRGAEYGNSRIVIGAHYAMDVLGGRTLALYDVAHLLAGDPAYVGRTEGGTTIADYAAAVKAARTDLTATLSSACGKSLDACASDDTSRFSDSAKDEAFYESTQTYGLPVVFDSTAKSVEDVATVAPEAGNLLTAAFPNLTLAQADKILTATEGPGGGFLDNGSAFGVYSRLDLYKAALAASAPASGNR